MAARPSKKSIQRLTGKVYDLLRPREKGAWPEVRDHLNAQLRGWRQYFNHGTIARAYQIVNHYVERRVRNFLRQRHKHSTVGTRRFPAEMIFGELGVVRLARRAPACAA